ncbi:MAG: gliding motility protein GldL [Paludibacteraceae bacterium]|nr:gliding motility protein GldL [Paludibacteraceae bacterium]
MASFSTWWNSPKGKQVVNAAYSVGASIVILGAMFKILHLPNANYILGAGMICESLIFFSGAFDKPFKEYDWDKLFDFDNGKPRFQGGGGTVNIQHIPTAKVELNYAETIDENDVKKLSEGIKNLSTTAQQLASLSAVVGATEKFTQNIESASSITLNLIEKQKEFANALQNISVVYENSKNEIEKEQEETKQSLQTINKSLASINAIYEIQLKNIQDQLTEISQQNEHLKNTNEELKDLSNNMQKINSVSNDILLQTEEYKSETTKLSQKIVELNNIYGNMLNALS